MPGGRPCLPSDTLGDFAYFQGNTDVTAGTTKRFALADPTRVALIVANNLNISLFIGTHDTVDPGDPGDMLFLGVNTPPFTLYYRDVGALVCSEWWIGCIGANADLSWIEVYYRPAVANPQ